MQRDHRAVRRRLTGAGLVAALLLSGCSAVDGLVPVGERSVVSAARHPVAVAGAVDAAPTRRPRRKPPGFIQWWFANNGTDHCSTIPADAPAVRIEATRLEWFRLCVAGYPVSPSLHLWISTPEGPRREIPALYRGDKWTWDLQPGAEGDRLARLGTYRFDITREPQDGGPVTLVTSGRIVVRRSPERRVVFADDRGGEKRALRPGDSVRARLAGYRPGHTVRAALYQDLPDDYRMRYLADLPDTVVGRSGEGTFRWLVPAELAPGYYGIWIETGPDSWDGCGACEGYQVGGDGE
ncbi:hypothetical protein AB0F81_35730 [Actinoplanes sp. NPDC024001]|uniref:hypothetical protein n=1 Tax=Actinoplanes sp. NPDC024001 TaxID=3154598 RepID=UPI0033F217F3